MGKETFFSIKGRLRRRDYLIRTLLIGLPPAILEMALKSTLDPALMFFADLIVFASGVLIAIQAVKRLHDINRSGWYWLLFLIPLVNIFFGLYLLFKDGTHGQNKYGEDPKGRQRIEMV